jgi:type IV secretory pathway VirB2 component (pilin)
LFRIREQGGILIMRKSIIIAAVWLLSATLAFAFTPTGMPWDGPLQTLLNGAQGGLAYGMVAIGIIVAGIGWTFWQEFNPAMRAMVGVVGGGAVACFALQVMTAIGLGGFTL